MERKEAIRGAYRMTGGNSFYDGMITCSTPEWQSGMPPCVGYEQGGKRRLSGKSTVRYSGAFFRQAAGGAGRDRDSDHAGLSDYAAGGHYLSGLFARYDEAGTGKG